MWNFPSTSPKMRGLIKSFQTTAHTQRYFETGSKHKTRNSYSHDSDYSVWSSPLHLNWQRKKWHYLTCFPVVINWPHLKVVATWVQKPFSSVTTETNIETPVFSRKFTYELHTKFLWSDKLFWTRMKKILLLHYHPPLDTLCCLYKKTSTSKTSKHSGKSISCLESMHRNRSLEIRPYISRAFRFPDFLPERPTC